jgi:hypothetical protein
MKMKKQLNNLLMIAGTGRNVGKTMLACKLIGQFSHQDVVGIKVSPHFHQQAEGQKILVQRPDFMIIEETSASTSKDSSRMLQAGASKVYYIQTHDRIIGEPFRIILSMLPENQPVICESGALLAYAKPALFFLVYKNGGVQTKPGLDSIDYDHDQKIAFDGEGFDFNFEKIRFEDHSWVLKK